MSDTKKKRSRPAISDAKKKGSPPKPRKLRIEDKRKEMRAASPDGRVVPLMSARQISDYLGIGRSTLRRYVRSGLIPEIQLGGHRKYDVLAVRAALYRNS